MASIQTIPTGGYRVFVAILGTRRTKIFPTKREAREWGFKTEQQIRDLLNKPAASVYTLGEALEKYAREVSEKKKGKRWEQVRLQAFKAYRLPLSTPLANVSAEDIAVFRDSRLVDVSPSSVRRELSLLSSVFSTARLDWGWGNENPCFDIRKPKSNPNRDRLIKWWEIKRMLRGLGYAPGKRVASTYQAVGLCFLLALRTGMRAGELCKLRWADVDQWHVHLEDTKNGSPRDVPLCSRSRRYIAQLKGWHPETVTGVKSASLDAIFRKIRGRTGLEGFTFHDSRHFAATHLSSKLEVLELCRMFGWKDPRMALVYYAQTAQALSRKLG